MVHDTSVPSAPRRWLPLATGALFIFLWASPLGAEDQRRAVFGPEVFEKTSGATEAFGHTFTVPASTSAAFTLCLVNGDQDEKDEEKDRAERCQIPELRGYDRDDEDEDDDHHEHHGKKYEHRDPEAVSSGRVLVDGHEVVFRRELNKREDVIEKHLRLTPGPHRLRVELHGHPGSHITLAIVGVMRLGKLAQARAGHTATLMPDGTVLFTGGRGKDKDIQDNAEVFDPRTLNSARLPAELTTARAEHTGTLLPNGEVLVAAGRDAHGVLFSAELGTLNQTFEALSSTVQVARVGHTATLLPDGRVVILGGLDASHMALAEGEAFEVPSGLLYDLRSGQFSVLPHALAVPRHNHTSTLLPNGLILVVGGRHEDEVLSSAELFDPATGESHLLDVRLHTARARHSANLLNDGRLLIAGGRTKKDALRSVEVFDPETQTFAKVRPKLRMKRFNHTATVLPSGDILLAGGREDEDRDPTKDTDLYFQPGRDSTPPTVLEITPASSVSGISSTPLLAIRFSEPINVTTLKPSTMTLTGPQGLVPGTVSPGEEGLLAFFLPTAPLTPGTTYTLALQGVTDRASNPLPPLTSRFTTGGARPAISGFSPGTGIVGATVVLTGENFDSLPANNQVKFNGVLAVVTAATATGITTSVPPGATTGPISVTTPGGTATSSTNFIVSTGPTILSLSPASGPVGTTVTITGSGFDATPGGTTVTFGGNAIATITSATSTELLVTVPTAATTGSVTVSNANGATTSPAPFTVLVPPIIVGVEPSRVAQGTTMQVVIAGFNLASATSVTFTQPGLTATIVSGATASTLPVNVTTASSVPEGAYTFSVGTPGGEAASGPVTVTVTPAVPSFGLGQASVFLPFPAQTAPAGASMSVTPPTSVQMPP